MRTADQTRRDRLSGAVTGLTILLLAAVSASVVAVTMLIASGGGS